jgi:hypothetical protein
VHIRRLGVKYGISVDRAMMYPLPKYAWKLHVNNLITQHWLVDLTLEARQKKTLDWLILDPSWIGHPHPLWWACRGKPFQVEAAAVRALLLTGRYGLQADRVHYTKQESNPICLLCQTEEENAVHFCILCPIITEDVKSKVSDLLAMYTSVGQRPPKSPLETTSAILNGWAYVIDGSAHSQPHHHSQVNTHSNSQFDCHFNCHSNLKQTSTLGNVCTDRGITSSSTVPTLPCCTHPEPTPYTPLIHLSPLYLTMSLPHPN